MTNESHAEHILPLWTYLKVGLALLALTIVTVWVAQYHLGPFNLLVAMIIAASKGTLVALYFMHLKYANRLFAVVFVGALLMLAVFIIFTMLDTVTRDEIYPYKAKPINDRAVIYQQETPTAQPAAADTTASATPADTSGEAENADTEPAEGDTSNVDTGP